MSLFGGPSHPVRPTTASSTYADSATPVTVATGSDTGDHTTTGAPVAVRPVDFGDVAPELGILWTLRTRNGASYDVATYTVKYTFLTPSS